VFGVSFTEVILIAIVALVVVGPRRLPEMLGTAGKWIGKLRNITSEMRRQTGIDEILREEGIQGGLRELRSIMRPGIGNLASLATASHTNAGSQSAPAPDPYGESTDFDRDREYPGEGPDAYGAIPEDLLPTPPAELASPVVASAATDSIEPTKTVEPAAVAPAPAARDGEPERKGAE
jgi:sec-independent protein translocase protein TatB